MLPFFKDYIERLQEQHADIEKSLEGLSQEALDWTPAPGANSISVIIVHLTGAERFWVGDVARGDPSHRNRGAEFQVKGLEMETLVKRLRDAEAYVSQALESMNLADLELQRTSPSNGKSYTTAYTLLHTLEHTALHAGHIEITSQLWKNTGQK
jgi:uncharacterized damage-inducible protein DinB